MKQPKTYYDVKNCSSRIIVNQGGSRSGKTYSILQVLLEKALTWNGAVITICRKTFPALRGSVMRDFFEILEREKMYNVRNHNKSEATYIFNGNLFEFISLDQPQKVRGRKRNVLFINEANEVDWDSWIQLTLRTTDKVILDYNPSMEFHWIYDQVIPRDDCSFFQTTYKDNPFLPPETVAEIERLKQIDENYWKIYGLGEKGHIEGLVFTNWSEGKQPKEVKRRFYGLDFGYTNDPTALIELSQVGDDIYVRELIYQTGLTNQDIARRMKQLGITYDDDIYADSSEPKSIDEIRREGFNVKPVTKGRDSINFGIDLVKRYRLVVDPGSLNMIKELRNYKWDKDKDGRTINKPVDLFNHGIDAMRYAMIMKYGRREFIVT